MKCFKIREVFKATFRFIPVLRYLFKVQSHGYAFKSCITEKCTSAGKSKYYHMGIRTLFGNEDPVKIFNTYNKY